MPKPFGTVQPNDVEDEDGINNPEEVSSTTAFNNYHSLHHRWHRTYVLQTLTNNLSIELSDSSYQMSV